MSESLNENKFVYGVLDTFELMATRDIAVVGRLKGTINKGDKIFITNYGDDDDELVVSTAVALEVEKKEVDTATDCFVAIRIRDGLSENIKPGSVIHSEDTSEEDIHLAYVSAIGDSYVGRRDLEIYETEQSKMSITDCTEAWRIFIKVHEKKEGGFSQDEVKEFRRKIGVVARALSKKLLSADEIYCVYNKRTGEPHMFSRTNKVKDDYVCSPPEIHIFSKPYKGVGEKHFPSDLFEIRKIENGDNNDGIKNFLFDAFYLNGAMGVRVNFEAVAIGADSIIQKPNYYGMKENEIPVTNPNLVRWMLLRSQIANPSTEAEKMVAKIYYRFFAIEVLKAKFLVPAKAVEEGENPVEIPEEIAKEAGDAELKRLRFPIMVGKNRRNLVFLFTDMKRLRGMYDEEWSAFSQTLDKFIGNFDVGLNISNKYSLGCYVNKDTYDEIHRMLGMEVEKVNAETLKKEEPKEESDEASDKKDEK